MFLGTNMNKYRSKLEERVAAALGEGWDYEKVRVSYSVERKYTVDFSNGNVYIEVKGYFRAGDTQKYRAVHRNLCDNKKRFIMLLQYPDKPVRTGAKLTMSQWCDKFGITWYAVHEVKTLLQEQTGED